MFFMDLALFEEYALTRNIDLRNELLAKHLPLARYVAAKMSSALPSHIDMDDLVSWGCIGLMDAIEKFDPTRGAAFSTYAVPRIRGEILDELQKLEWAPKQVVSNIRRARRVASELTNLLGRQPTADEIADHLAVPVADVMVWLIDDNTTRLGTLSASEFDDDADLANLMPTEDAVQDVAAQAQELYGLVGALLDAFSEAEVEIFQLYYGQNLTLREIAVRKGVSVSLTTQAHTRLVDRIRTGLQLA